MNIQLIDDLKNRGILSQITDEYFLQNLLLKTKFSLYCGFDPTADSLHLGHLLPLMCLKRFQNIGCKPIILLGGATSLIGDPSFKEGERILNLHKDIKQWTEKISSQIKKILNFNCGENSAIIINNYNWFKDINVLKFLRDIGKYFSVNQMINKESVKKRFFRKDKGISFTEFSYSLLQAYDFTYVYKNYNVMLQIGGSDQWGNITAGIDLTYRLYKKKVLGLTIPLITKSDGKKFGKTEKDNIWIDKEKTTPYSFYQFWINTSDTDVYRFMKLFTFIDIKKIQKMEKKNDVCTLKKAKEILANEMTRIVHGEKKLFFVKKISKILFTDELYQLKEKDFEDLIKNGIPTINIFNNLDLQQTLIYCKFITSRTQAKILIKSNAIKINSKKVNDINYIFNNHDKIFNRFTLLCRGKKKYCLIQWI